ncbi:MAG TPA: hypothetical protein DEQ87_13665 [Algoriphagus sp.]|jgi:hypothetical protein|uniref:hypothetical protein n=1 Tax=unclassified Algoriphagus TaxID=2641541 RepID=UPI000C44A9D3|nr:MULTISPECIES: hypothetical protein [unclassified Algoriphagus]MAL15102.1 hypothetical protein [Algoriphagus sp.]MAN87866.1 hypothetical protein [Algoriphagus sp.]HAD49923.1 hypothetical protein [Algoriphagus sp.]HAH36811.1 hypothetical protein [Algoriphagus sp.]HAS57301.1 hypothetical protein [Algoriphagus sp.]|tara:strand:+ start:17555 stop:18043 length:489 start_codon:yes stop_codon:yes gene_type:complete
MKTMIQVWDRYSQEPPLKQLTRLMEVDMTKSYPSVPSHARRKITFRDHTANDLTSSIIAFFNLQGGFAERINNMGQQLDRKGERIWVKGNGKDGTADISATFNGISVKVEVKAGNDRQSDAQKEYQRRIEAAGGIYIIARNFDGFIYEFFRRIDQKGNERVK